MNILIDRIVKAFQKPVFKIKPPSMYKVIILNDNVTPMDFVVEVLIKVFHKDSTTAFEIMMISHKSGSCLCGVYPFEVAEMKVKQVKDMAVKNKYPLNCVMQEE